MDVLQTTIHEELGIGLLVQGKLLFSLLAILTILIIRFLVIRIIIQRKRSSEIVYQWRKHSSRISFIVALILLGAIWLESVKTLGTFLGLFTAGVAIALKDLLTNFAGWIFIAWRKPFQVSDRIQIGNHSGDVIDIRIFQFTILETGNWVDADQSTGRLMHIPNGQIFSNPVANYTAGFNYIWNEIPVLITFESDWEKATDILQTIANEQLASLAETAVEEIRKASYQYLITYKTLTPVVYTSVKDSGVLLTIRYLCRPRTRRGTEETVWKAVLTAFAEHSDIDFAYPTQRFYTNATEGKPGTRPGALYSEPTGDSE